MYSFLPFDLCGVDTKPQSHGSFYKGNPVWVSVSGSFPDNDIFQWIRVINSKRGEKKDWLSWVYWSLYLQQFWNLLANHWSSISVFIEPIVNILDCFDAVFETWAYAVFWVIQETEYHVIDGTSVQGLWDQNAILISLDFDSPCSPEVANWIFWKNISTVSKTVAENTLEAPERHQTEKVLDAWQSVASCGLALSRTHEGTIYMVLVIRDLVGPRSQRIMPWQQQKNWKNRKSRELRSKLTSCCFESLTSVFQKVWGSRVP